MILQELHSYYMRKIAEQHSIFPLYGTSLERISFALVLSNNGILVDIEDLRVQETNTLFIRKIPVPAAVIRTSGIKANFLWDKTEYVLGSNAEGATDRNLEAFEAFRKLFEEVVKNVDDIGVGAVRNFLREWEREKAEDTVEKYQLWNDLCNANLVFRLDGSSGYIHNRPSVHEAWLKYCRNIGDVPKVQCLITGEKNTDQARIHTPIKGVRGGQTSGGYIVSYNATAFTSYGKSNDYNAPVAETSAFAYTTALNALLDSKSRQKVHIGDTSIVFWAKRQSPAEDWFADLFDPPADIKKRPGKELSPEEVDDQQTTEKIKGLLRYIRDKGSVQDIMPGLEEDVDFYILGLAPNASRLSIRFWLVTTTGDLLSNIRKFYKELNIARTLDSEREFPPMWLLLCHTAVQGKNENLSPVLAGSMAKAMISGGRYPQSLLSALLERIRAEHEVTYYRAALLKALLSRNERMEVSVSLNIERTDMPYLLGRLFAVLEKAQEEAIPGANATIKDRYLSAASATPGLVFHLLLKYSSNHIAKLRKDASKHGRAIYLEKRIQDILAGIEDFPSTMPAIDQGLFMIGYYHQRKDFFTKKELQEE